MRESSPTFLVLDGRNGWRTGAADGVAANGSVQLKADPNGRLRLDSGDGSLGGLRLPPTIAVDAEGRVYLLGPKPWYLLRYDYETQGFARVAGIGGAGRRVRQFGDPAAIAIRGRSLYVADTSNRRVQVFSLDTYAVLDVIPLRGEPGDRQILDFAVSRRGVCILDGPAHRVWRYHGLGQPMELLADGGERPLPWSSVAVDRNDAVYVREGVELLRVDGKRIIETFQDAAEVADRFSPPPIRLDHKLLFCLPAGLASACPHPDTVPSGILEQPLRPCLGRPELLFGLDGQPAVLGDAEPAGPPVFLRSGTWFSDPLDSGIYRCQWHRIQMEIGSLCPGAAIRVSTFSDQARRPLNEIDPLQWIPALAAAGASQDPAAVKSSSTDALIQSGEGRFLRVRIDFAGDGYASPMVRSMRVHFPRESYLSFLPPVFSADDESRWFLQRFLSIVQTEWDSLDERIDRVAVLFDPCAVPDSFVPWLASWLALPLERTWTPDQQRRLLGAAPEIYKRRGTLESFRAYLRVYLSNMSGMEVPEHSPPVLEGYKERQRMMLSREGVANQNVPLWSPSYVARLRLSDFSREGEARLVSTGDPQHDLFQEFAHRFFIFLPGTLLRTADQERMIRRAIEAEKPAHTVATICAVEPRFRVGVQSTVGLDAVVGGVPRATLANPADDQAATVASLRNRLGFDTVLNGSRDGVRRGPARAGIDTELS